jgi:hypothetical protein
MSSRPHALVVHIFMQGLQGCEKMRFPSAILKVLNLKQYADMKSSRTNTTHMKIYVDMKSSRMKI